MKYTTIQLGWRYLSYFLRASNGKGHGIHSPYVFDFVIRILNDDRTFYAFSSISSVYHALLNDVTEIKEKEIFTHQAFNTQKQTVQSIARSKENTIKYGQLLFRMVDYYAPEKILVLGTSLGISAAYLASANSKAHVFAVESSIPLAEISRNNFKKLSLDNISLENGQLDLTLTSILSKTPSFDFMWVNDIQEYELQLQIFNQLLKVKHDQTILVFNKIHQSAAAEKAWKEMKEHVAVTLTIDLFNIGIVLFRKENKAKQHFTIRY